jgi:hypothetical protein
MADQRCGCHALFFGQRRRRHRHRRRRLAHHRCFEETCDYVHVSNFSITLYFSFFFLNLNFLSQGFVSFRAGAAVGAAATANAGGIVAAGGAALSAGAGAVASAASALFGSVSGAGEGTASAAPPGGPRPHHSTGARSKRKVIFSFTTLSAFPTLSG